MNAEKQDHAIAILLDRTEPNLPIARRHSSLRTLLHWRSWVRHPGLFREPEFRAHHRFGLLPPEFPREVPSAFGSSRSRPGLHTYRYPRTRAASFRSRLA